MLIERIADAIIAHPKMQQHNINMKGLCNICNTIRYYWNYRYFAKPQWSVGITFCP
jgi:hypothetical protein